MPVNDTPSQVTIFGTNNSARKTMINFNPYSLPVMCFRIYPDEGGDTQIEAWDRLMIRKVPFYYHKAERSDMFIAVYVDISIRANLTSSDRRALTQDWIRSNIGIWNSLKYNDSIDPLPKPADMTLWQSLWTA